MVYTDLTRKAAKIACSAHHGQTDKGGMPYILHPVHLAEQMEDEVSCCAALLHDVAEDTSVTLEALAEEFPREVMEVLQLLTHRPGVPYCDYVRSIRSHPIALKIKLADIAHNCDQSRLAQSGLSGDQLACLRQKYAEALQILTGE